MPKEIIPGNLIITPLKNMAAVILASLLFAASHPNLLFAKGLPLLAWISLVPVFWVVRQNSYPSLIIYGAFYGYASYGLFNYWLSVFHPLAGLIVGSIYLVYFAFLFPLLHLAHKLFPLRGYILHWLIWIAYEYLKTQAFLGYSYGVMGYSQWNIIPLIQIADLAGVWIVSALVVFPSAWLAGFFCFSDIVRESVTLNEFLLRMRIYFRRERLPIIIWFAVLVLSFIYGFTSQINYTDADTIRIAMIQHNTDPWAPSHAPTYPQAMAEYRNDFNILRRLSDEALAAYPDTDMVVWSETAFVVRIYWHTTYRDDPLSWDLVRDLMTYLRSQEVPFVFGNDDARRDPAINPDPLTSHRIDYNAVMLYDRGELAGIYRKQHLVPFTEHFPYRRQLPWIYEALRNADTHFWERGNEATVLESRGIRFSTPICFEDTFGYLTREFVRNGAELIVNLSNDAWSASLAAQMQHLSMAIFRSVENRRSMARSTSSGQTAAIDPNGRIIAMAEPFTEAWLSVEVPIISTPFTVYTRYGDYLGMIFFWLSIFMLIIGGVLYIIKKFQGRSL